MAMSRAVVGRRAALDELLQYLNRREVVVIFGPPGTGKTHYGTKLCFRGEAEIEGQRLELGRRGLCLALYFNRSMKDDALARDFRAKVSTLDSAAYAAAKRLGYTLPDRLPNGRKTKDAEKAVAMWRWHICKKHGMLYSLDPYAPGPCNEKFREFEMAANLLGEWRRDKLFDDYIEILRKNNWVDFTLARILASRHGSPHCVYVEGHCVRPRLLFIDEAQDFSPLMWRIVTRLFPDAETVIIAGDDDQTVYTDLHGADHHILLEIARRLKNGELKGHGPIVLKQSKRVAAAVAQFAKSVISHVRDRWQKDWSGREAEAYVKVVDFETAIGDIAKKAPLYENAGGGYGIFALAPTNDEVLFITAELLKRGVLPGGLKERLPPLLDAALEAALSGDGERLAEIAKINRHIAAAAAHLLKARGREDVKHIYREVMRGRAAVYVDTPHAAKGLEADVVYVFNFTRHRRAVGSIRPFYVAVTRSKSNVYLVTPPKGAEGVFHLWIDTHLLSGLKISAHG